MLPVRGINFQHSSITVGDVNHTLNAPLNTALEGSKALPCRQLRAPNQKL